MAFNYFLVNAGSLQLWTLKKSWSSILTFSLYCVSLFFFLSQDKLQHCYNILCDHTHVHKHTHIDSFFIFLSEETFSLCLNILPVSQVGLNAQFHSMSISMHPAELSYQESYHYNHGLHAYTHIHSNFYS